MKKSNTLLPAVALLALTACSGEKQNLDKPNIVFILTDQWRGSALGYAGDPNVQTPYLDKFAKESVNMTNTISVCPVSTPARAALQTGRYPTSTGMFLNDIYLPSEELCMAEIFGEQGYTTAYLGKWHIDGHGRTNNVIPARRQGWQYWKGLECSHNYNKMAYYENDDPDIKYWKGYSPVAICDEANRYLAEHRNDKNPFLLFVSLGTPHFPHQIAPEEVKKLYPKDSLIMAPNIPEEKMKKARQELQGYYAHCTATDKAIGSVIQAVKDLGLSENTVVIFTSDHGEMMGAHGVFPRAKQEAWEESIRVPFLITYPGIGENKGTTVNAPINTTDILPTMLGMAGLKIPDTIEGDDLSGLMLHPDPELDRATLSMNPAPFDIHHLITKEFRVLRSKQYSYIVSADGPEHLYDIIKDPYQMNDLLDDPQYAKVREGMDKELKRQLKKIGDEVIHKGDYYIKKWNFQVDEKYQCVDATPFDIGQGTTQFPHLLK